MSFLPCVALLLVPQKLEDTHGKTYTQIVAMGRSRWHDFYLGKDGGSTAGESSAEGIYGDALAWRNDRLLKKKPSPLRKALQAYSTDAVSAGYCISGGGTMWNITGASLYADAEETLYAVLTRTGKAPHRKVSDAAGAVAKLRKGILAIEADRPKDRKNGLDAIQSLEKDLKTLAGLAARMPRRESDVILEFCRSVATNVNEQAGPI